MRWGVWILGLGMATTVWAGPMDRVQKACNSDRYSQTCLTALMVYHCGSYTSVVHKLGRCWDRARDASRLLRPLSTTRDEVVEVVAFPHELLFLLRQPFTKHYLKELRDGLARGYRLGEKVDLWGLSVKLTGDRAKALWVIGVLLQDTSPQQVPLWYVEKKGRVDDSLLELWGEVLDLLDPEQLREEKARTWLTLYPPMKPSGAEARFSSKLYHFYTLAYLGMRLRWESADRGMAWFIPTLIEASYKFKQMDADRWPRAPLPFDITKSESPVIDIYTTYLASHWAVGSRHKPMKYGTFAADLAEGPGKFMKRLFDRATSGVPAVDDLQIDRVLP